MDSYQITSPYILITQIINFISECFHFSGHIFSTIGIFRTIHIIPTEIIKITNGAPSLNTIENLGRLNVLIRISKMYQ